MLQLDREGLWSKVRAYDTVSGRREDYRCNKVPSRGEQCAAGFQLLFNADSFQVTSFATEQQHTHEEILSQTTARGINKTTKDAIDRLLALKVTAPKTIRDNLAKEAESNPGISLPKDERQLYKLKKHSFVKNLHPLRRLQSTG